MTDHPIIYKFWCQSARDKYNERIAMMRDGNNIPPDAETPLYIKSIAFTEAQAEHEEVTELAKEQKEFKL